MNEEIAVAVVIIFGAIGIFLFGFIIGRLCEDLLWENELEKMQDEVISQVNSDMDELKKKLEGKDESNTDSERDAE